MKMMGKRVNFSSRSVISPDPFLKTDEVGVPLAIASKLTYPEAVNSANAPFLMKCILHGSHTYPGALMYEEKGKVFFLETASAQKRMEIARSLKINPEDKIVYRHMVDGDLVLFNRQPTLHKPSLLAFKARIMPSELTIRMHYANCSGFNADFDGDEMNVHLLQNCMARAEASFLALSDRHLVLPTNKQPVRGFIQDFVFAAVFLSLKDSFFEIHEYSQLLYAALGRDSKRYIPLIKPALFLPKKLWTGKQLVSNILMVVSEQLANNEVGLCLESKCRLFPQVFDAISAEDSKFILRKNYVCTGVLDKNQIGASSFGLLHSFYELYGHKRTNNLFSALTSLLIEYLRMRGFTVGIRDLLLTEQAENTRAAQLQKLTESAVNAQREWLGNCSTRDMRQVLAEKLSTKSTMDSVLDTVVKRSVAPNQNALFDTLTHGLQLRFPFNNFSSMVLTGAKGSTLNHGQVSINLGQQELEGKRVPFMASGKTLPCFAPHDPDPRSGGFIGDRFLTGLGAPEFFFHCMAGREGLIDTAVKTSRSGYLQRTLMKNLESLVVGYDYSVRDIADNSII